MLIGKGWWAASLVSHLHHITTSATPIASFLEDSNPHLLMLYNAVLPSWVYRYHHSHYHNYFFVYLWIDYGYQHSNMIAQLSDMKDPWIFTWWLFRFAGHGFDSWDTGPIVRASISRYLQFLVVSTKYFHLSFQFPLSTQFCCECCRRNEDHHICNCQRILCGNRWWMCLAELWDVRTSI